MTTRTPTDALVRDPLTGALPKSQLSKRLRDVIEDAEQSGKPFAMLVVDLDHFKSINDAFGHARGDDVLREFGTRLSATLRAGDLPFRYGGDEFVVLLRDTTRDAAAALANRLLARVVERPVSGEPSVAISVTIGVSCYPEDGTTEDALFTTADRRVYEAKRQGRGRVVYSEGPSSARDPFDTTGRLIDRDTQNEILQHFLRRQPDDPPGVLTVRGVRGSGRSRFLAEAGTMATLLGLYAVPVRARRAIHGKAYGALGELRDALGGTLPIDAAQLTEALRELIKATSRSGVLLLVDDAVELDEASHDLIAALLRDRTSPLVGVIATSDPDAPRSDAPFESPRSAVVEMTGMSEDALRSWLRQLLQWEAPADFVAWLREETEGLPSRVRDALRYLMRTRAIVPQGSGWQLMTDPASTAVIEQISVRRPTPVANMPVVQRALVGRDREVADVIDLLRHHRLVSVLGPGGIGKTRVALQVAAEEASFFTHGVTFVPLLDLNSSDHVPTAIADALALPLAGDQPALHQVINYLRGRHALLVLDNAEHLGGLALVVGDLLDGTRKLRILVTSRERVMVPNEATYELAGMPYPPLEDPSQAERYHAVQLFVQRARQVDSRFVLRSEDKPHVARLCATVGGVPLALEMAAWLVRAMSCREIADEIARSLDTISADAATAAGYPPRQRSLRAVFEYSWKLISEPERRTLARLSVLRGTFTRETAERVAATTVSTLLALVDKSLVRRIAGRFEIHEICREFASEKLWSMNLERAAAESARSGFFGEFLRSRDGALRGGGQRAALREIAAEMANIREGWRWAVSGSDGKAADGYVAPLWRFLAIRGWYREGLELFSLAAERLRPDAPLRPRALLAKAYFATRLSALDEARTALREAGRLLKNGTDADRADLAAALGSLAARSGRYGASARLFRRAIRLHETGRRDVPLADALEGLALSHLAAGNAQEADPLLRRALELRRDAGDQWGLSKALNNLAVALDDEEGRPFAEHLFRESLDLARQTEDARQVAIALHNLGMLTFRMGDHDEAISLLEEAIGNLRELGNREAVAGGLCNLAEVARSAGDLEVAEDRLREAMALATDAGSAPRVMEVLVGFARVREARGDHTHACRLASIAATHPSTRAEDRIAARQIVEACPAEQRPADPGARPLDLRDHEALMTLLD